MTPLIPQLQSPPRVRVEWLIAGARTVLALGTLVAVVFGGTPEPSATTTYPYLVDNPAARFTFSYFIYSLAVLALVWSPVRFGRGWDIVLHIVDMAAYAMWLFVPPGPVNPVVLYYAFIVVCATIRWQSVGTLWTAVAGVLLHAMVGTYLSERGSVPVPLNAIATRSLHLVLLAGLIAYLSAHQNRFQYEISRLASWPRTPTRDRREIVSEIIRQSSEFLRAPRIVLLWEEPGEGWVNVAWHTQDELMWTHEPEATYGSFVLPGLERNCFQVADASKEARVLLLRETGFRRRVCRPVNEALRLRFHMSAVQSWPFDGELVRGRMFCLDKVRMRLDDLILGEVVAWLAVTRLENYYFQDRLRDAAALEERVRLARDLHDSLLQAQAGAALQLAAARRLLDRDPAAGKERLGDVQEQLERDELEMRSFVLRLRPAPRPVAPPASLGDRLDELRERVERQWEIHVKLQLDGVDGLPDELLEGTYRLAQESMVNAARHADASMIDVTVSKSDGHLRLRIADDGRGFPFQGVYDLAALNTMKEGPLSLKERVADLGGDMTLISADTGTELLITLPLARSHV